MAITISGDLIAHVRFLLLFSLKRALSDDVARHGINAAASFAFPAYITAVASVEAFLNEHLLGYTARMFFRESPLWSIDYERWDIGTKLIIVPQILFGVTFDKGAQPAQDFLLLVRVRNDIVHYKMQENPPKYIADLSQRGIALTSDHLRNGGPDYLWPQKLSSTEGIRWAHNTACKVIHKLVEFIPEEHRDILGSLAVNYEEIPVTHIQEWFNRHDGVTNDTGTSDTPI
jgi:hypothetical protein